MRDKQKSSTDINYVQTTDNQILSPIVGASLSELLTLIITPALRARKEEWMADLGQKLKELEETNNINLQELSSNQQFIDTVFQATTFALKTNDQEKITSLKNAIVNTALNDTPEQTVSHIFLNLIDVFTSWHIKILELFDNPSNWFQRNNKMLPNYIASSLSTVIKEAFSELRGQDELLDLIWSDLKRAGFHNTSDLRTTMSGNGLLAERTTNLGKQFLKYIKAH